MTKNGEFKLSIVNNGEPFDMPNWTPRKHENALAKLSANKELTDEERDNEFKYYVIHETLLEIDKEVTLDDVRHIHPKDLIDLFHAVYDAGKKGIYNPDFREGKKKTPTPKK